MSEGQTGRSQSRLFLFFYVLAVAGGAIAYVPFVTIILPSRVTDLAGPDAVRWVAYAAFAGAIAASIANIAFGWLSDILQKRRTLICCGMVASSAVLVSFPYVETLTALLVFVIVWQMALNMVLSPLAALAGDCVPDHQKGTLGGLLAIAPAMGAISGVVATYQNLFNFETRLWLVVFMVIACILPLLTVARPERFEELEPGSEPISQTRGAKLLGPSAKGHIAVIMWISRMLIQICLAALFVNVLFWFRSIDPGFDDAFAALIFSGVVVAAIPVAIAIGRWADQHSSPITPLALCAFIVSLGLVLMALSPSPVAAIASYTIFSLAASVFLSLHTGQTLWVLPKPRHRGRDLGIFNLTNTVPSLAMPWLVLWLVPVFGFPALLAVLSLCACLAAILLWRIRSSSRT